MAPANKILTHRFVSKIEAEHKFSRALSVVLTI